MCRRFDSAPRHRRIHRRIATRVARAGHGDRDQRRIEAAGVVTNARMVFGDSLRLCGRFTRVEERWTA